MNDREFGTILGACIGDMAGKHLEFLGRPATADEIAKSLRYAKSHRNKFSYHHYGHACGGCENHYWQEVDPLITDDSQMTLRLGLTIRNNDWHYDREKVAKAYWQWANQPDLYDIGYTTANALRCPKPQTGKYYETISGRAQRLNQNSEANGALMRCSPIAILGARQVTALEFWDACLTDCSLTHPHENCVQSNWIYLRVMRRLLLGEDWTLEIPKIVEFEPHQWVHDALNGFVPATTPNDGHVRIALQLAFYHLGKGTPFWEAIEDVVSRGGDTDTLACTVGAMLGARDGAQAINQSA